MRPIAVVTDSGSDLSAALCAQYGITQVPLIVRFGPQTYLGGELDPDAFWRLVGDNGALPETSQPSVGMFERAFAALVGQGYHVLCLVVTATYSGTINAAHAAAAVYRGRVTIYDTGSFSLGQGYQALAAARAANDGWPLERILQLVQSIRQRTHLLIGLDTIENLRRGGRATALIPVLEKVVKVLDIKPLLRMADGQMSLLGIARSSAKLVRRLRREVADHLPLEQLMVGHTRQPGLAAELAANLAQAAGVPERSVMLIEIGPALACHAGRGVLAAGIVTRAG